jgi:hypothetical protein
MTNSTVVSAQRKAKIRAEYARTYAAFHDLVEDERKETLAQRDREAAEAAAAAGSRKTKILNETQRSKVAALIAARHNERVSIMDVARNWSELSNPRPADAIDYDGDAFDSSEDGPANLSIHNGTSRQSDLENIVQVTDQAIVLERDSRLRLEFARAAGASIWHDRGSEETRADGTSFRRPTTEQPHMLGSPIYRPDGGGWVALDMHDVYTYRNPPGNGADPIRVHSIDPQGDTLAVENGFNVAPLTVTCGRYFAVQFDKLHLDPNRPAHMRSLQRVRLGRPQPRHDKVTGLMPMQWVHDPQEYIGAATADEAERLAWLWSTESNVTDSYQDPQPGNEFPHLAGRGTRKDRLAGRTILNIDGKAVVQIGPPSPASRRH